MFKELMPVIGNRPLTLTIAQVADGKIRVCVVPQAQEKDRAINTKIGHRKEVEKIPDSTIQGLTTPLSVTGTPEELDSDLPETLTKYASSHEQLQQGIIRATDQINDALKALDERDKAKKTKPASSAKNPGKNDDKAETKDASHDTSGTLPLDWLAQPTASPAVTASDVPAESASAQTGAGKE